MQENQSQVTERVNLLNFDVEGIKAWCAALGEKPYRAIQLSRWMHRHCEDDFDAMSNLAKSFRAKLHDLAYIKAPPVITVKHSADGTRKWLFDVGNGNAVEAVFIPEDDRGTLCISTQAGCAMGCLFCSTGKQGFNRNLTTAEIVGQLWHAERTLRKEAGVTDPNDRIISNVVLMGMGEPLQNLSNVIPALRLFLDDNGYGLSRRRVTVSTSGLVNQIDKLGAEVPVALAVSLHAPDDALRDMIMPVNKKHPLEDLIGPIQLCHRQDHIDQPSPAISVTDGGVQQFLTLGQLVELPVLLRGHGELAQIPRLPQHPPQIDLAVDFFMIFGQRQGQGQHIFQGRAGQPDGHLTAGKHHAYQLVGGLTASDVHLVPPPFSVHLHLGSFFPSVVSNP